MYIVMIVLLVVVLIVIIVVGLAISGKRKQEFNQGLQRNIDKEIKDFLIEKHKPNYHFKNSEIEEELRQRLRAAMVDLRTDGYSYKQSYLNRTETKNKEIHTIINRYYVLDQKTSA